MKIRKLFLALLALVLLSSEAMAHGGDGLSVEDDERVPVLTAADYAEVFFDRYRGELPGDVLVRQMQIDLPQEGEEGPLQVAIPAAAWVGKGYGREDTEDQTAFCLMTLATPTEANHVIMGDFPEGWDSPDAQRIRDKGMEPLLDVTDHKQILRFADVEEGNLIFSQNSARHSMNDTKGSPGYDRYLCLYVFFADDALLTRARVVADEENCVQMVYSISTQFGDGSTIAQEFTFTVKLPE